MDIAKYIGLFLLKNRFCYVHGLGNIELKKLPSNFDGKLLLAPSYQIIVTSGGSIDDNLANFIASNEQVSISKASNELRDFSIQARKDMEEGKSVPLPGLGKFIEEHGKVIFITDENFAFTPAGLPTIRNSKQLEEQVVKPKQAPIPASIPIPPPVKSKSKSINWTMIILIIVLLIILGAGIGGFIYYKSSKLPPPPPEKALPLNKPPDTAQMRLDSIRVADSLRLAAIAADTLANSIRVVIGDYQDLSSADRYVKKLKGKGNNAEVYVKDTSNYLILTQITCKNKDTTNVFDSLKKVYNYQEVKSFK